ncbi:unnamed protein product [Rhizoctonia solani]|uniref:Uncharacterized protein n=1 Tax=Rhizoctonia solani TaxID=456999 RepID=A0A8H2X980_9AGAM|nr:unnamed protein product [Rhizoctonia solani]
MILSVQTPSHLGKRLYDTPDLARIRFPDGPLMPTRSHLELFSPANVSRPVDPGTSAHVILVYQFANSREHSPNSLRVDTRAWNNPQRGIGNMVRTLVRLESHDHSSRYV